MMHFLAEMKGHMSQECPELCTNRLQDSGEGCELSTQCSMWV